MKKQIPNIHPGTILSEKFLKPMHITPNRPAKETKIPATRVSEIVRGKRGITADRPCGFRHFSGTQSISGWEFRTNLRSERSVRA
jgi:addiction module HigA family antidote